MKRAAIARAFNQRVTPDGRRVVDVVMQNGTTVRGVAVMSGVALPLQVPLESEVPLTDYSYYPRVLVVYDGYTRKPVVVGAMDSRKVVYQPGGDDDTPTSGATDPDDVDDDTGVTFLEEARLDVANAEVVLRNTGKAVIRAGMVSLQVPPGGYLRISEAGDTAERTVLAGPVLAKMQQMVDTINELRQAVLDLQNALLLVTVAPPANSTLTTPTGGQVTGTLNIITSPVYTGLPEEDVDDLALTAAAIHMSARSEADEP